MPPPRDLAQTFGSRLRFLRAIKGLTQADLADRLNVSVKHIGRIERGEASPSFSLIQSLASVLETPPLNFFLQFEDDSTHSGTTGAASAPEADKPLCKQLCLAPDLAIWAPGDTQQLTYWSDSLYAMLGYAPRSVSPSAKRFLQHVVSREQPAAKDFLATIARDGQPEAALLCVNIVTRGKQHRKLLLKTETLRTYPGLPPQTQLIIQDITECVALNEAIATRQEELEAYVLHKNQDLAMALEKVQQEADWRAKAEQGLRIYEQMVHYAHDAQAFVDAAGTIIAVNRAYERLSGMAAHEVVGRGWAEYLAAYWGQEAFENIFKARVEDALHQGRHCSIQEWRTYQNGRRRFVHVIYTPCKEKDRLLGVVVTIHDLTDFMKMHERLEHQEQIYRQVLETAGEAIALLDTNLSVTYVNPKTISLFGFTEEELLGSSALTFVHPEDIDTAQQHLTQTLARHPTRFIARLVAKNGRVVWTQAATTTMHDAAGAVDGLLIMLMDITDLKTTELALRQREELLELTTEASLGLLRDRAHGQVVNDILARLGSLLAADRVYLFKNHDTEQTGEMLTSQIFEWAAPGISPQMGNPALQNLRYASSLPRWLRELSAGSCIKGSIQTFPDQERSLLAPQDIQSLLVVPIRMDGWFWGFLGLDAVQLPREWTATEEHILRIIAMALGTGIARTEAEGKITTQYDLLEGLFESIPLGVVIWDRHGNLLRSNQRFHDMIGFPRETIRHLDDWFPRAYPDEQHRRQVMEDWFGQGDQAGNAIREYPITTGTGSTRHIEFRARFLADGRSIITMADVTQRRDAERALQESREEFQAVAEKSPISIIRFDHQGLVTFVNDWHWKRFGRQGQTRSILLGKPVQDLPGLDSATLGPEIARVLEGHPIDLHEVFFPEFFNGRPGWAGVRAQPIHKNGAIDGGLLILEDVTWRKLLDRQLRDILHDRDKALQEKNAFFSIIAHDLKSPMSGLLSLAQVLSTNLESSSPKNLRRMVDTMDNTVRRIYSLLDNLLEWARMQRGLMAFEPTACLLHDMAAQVIGLFQATANQKQIALRNHVEPHASVCADRAMLEIIMRNLVSNALKFTKQGGTVAISATAGNPMVELTVQDTGIGMDPKLKDGIFSPTDKTNRRGTAGEQGSGLGLLLCREFVQKHGGEIRMESAPGHGSTFTVALPGTMEAC